MKPTPAQRRYLEKAKLMQDDSDRGGFNSGIPGPLDTAIECERAGLLEWAGIMIGYRLTPAGLAAIGETPCNTSG